MFFRYEKLITGGWFAVKSRHAYRKPSEAFRVMKGERLLIGQEIDQPLAVLARLYPAEVTG